MQQVMVCGGAANLLDCFEDASSAYLVQELCKGGDLRRHVEVSPGVGWRWVLVPGSGARVT